MARPQNKSELRDAAEKGYSTLEKLRESMNEEQREGAFTFEDRDRCVRDVLVHLHEWHLLLLQWVEKNRSGEDASFLPDGYTWKTYSQMNVEIRDRHQKTDETQAWRMLKESHENVMALIDSLTNEELFTKKYFSWTGTTSLGAYCISSTSSHYDWAAKKLRKHLKTSGK